MQKIKTIAVFLIFEVLVAYTFYLYSLRSNYVPWGAGLRDGLYFLAFFMMILPAMILLSIVKAFLKGQNIIVRFSYFLYALLITIPALWNIDTQEELTAGMIICVVIFFLNITEYVFILRNRIKQ